MPRLVLHCTGTQSRPATVTCTKQGLRNTKATKLSLELLREGEVVWHDRGNIKFTKLPEKFTDSEAGALYAQLPFGISNINLTIEQHETVTVYVAVEKIATIEGKGEKARDGGLRSIFDEDDVWHMEPGKIEWQGLDTSGDAKKDFHGVAEVWSRLLKVGAKVLCLPVAGVAVMSVMIRGEPLPLPVWSALFVSFYFMVHSSTCASFRSNRRIPTRGRACFQPSCSNKSWRWRK